MTRAELQAGAVLVVLRGLHRGQQIRVVKVTATSVEYQPLRPGSASYNRSHRKDMAWALTNCELR